MRNKTEIEKDIAIAKKTLGVVTDAEEKAMLNESLEELEAELKKAEATPEKKDEPKKEAKTAKVKAVKEPKGKKGKAKKEVKEPKVKVAMPEPTGKKTVIADKDKKHGITSETKFGNKLHVKSDTEYTIKSHRNEKHVGAITWNESKGQWDIDCCEIGNKHPKFTKGQVEQAIFWLEDFWECMETMHQKHKQIKANKDRAKERSEEGKPATLTVVETAKSTADKIEAKVEKLEEKDKAITARDVKSIAKELTDAIRFSAKHSNLEASQAKKVDTLITRFIAEIEKVLKGGKKKMSSGGVMVATQTGEGTYAVQGTLILNGKSYKIDKKVKAEDSDDAEFSVLNDFAEEHGAKEWDITSDLTSVKLKNLDKGGKVGKKEYVVNVGNIGNIECKNLKEANETYAEYVKQSKSDSGRASGEDVALMVNGEPTKEHFGSNHDND